jgi:hypothetical protein
MGLNLRIVLFTCFLALPVAATRAQSAMPKFLQRFQVGYSFLNAEANYRVQYPIENTDPLRIDRYFRDTIIAQDVKNKGGYGITAGTYVPLALLGKRSTLALTIDFVYNTYKWDYTPITGNIRLLPGQKGVVTGNTTQIGAPIGIDYKFGGDARLDRSRRLCASAGFGGAALSTTTEYSGNGNSSLKVYPYIKGEVGVLAGVCLKVRAMYTFGGFRYVNDRGPAADAQTGYFNSTVSLYGKSSLAISVIMMPFSKSWEKTRWWR